ncbi:hypothetical protein [Anatilimnocola floriformis]|uniref:hypothetical protein n=1 Tax=Anatilimnocola floriformis TaxID=2948575 RepID=UPI0020C1EAA0|nr:hypothetical protein [Anatilimnocola floriformis]
MSTATESYALCAEGRLQHHRVGTGQKKRFRFTEQQLADYLAATEVIRPLAKIIADMEKTEKEEKRQKRARRSSQVANEGYSRLREFGYGDGSPKKKKKK